MESKVSVIIPVYNAQKYLERCVASVINQTYKNIEIVLVDDGSTDSSLKTCEALAQADSRIKVIHKENEGAGIARNAGIEKATGEYICFVDSDDYLELSTINTCMQSVKDNLADTVVFGHSFVFDNGKSQHENINANRQVYTHTEIKQELLPSFFTLSMGFTVSVWGKLFSADIIRENNIRFKNEREIYSEDTLFLLEYFPKCKRAAVARQYLYNYFENDTSLSRVYEKEKEEKLNVFLSTALEIAKAEGLDENMMLHIKARYQSCAMVEYKQIVLSDKKLCKKLLAIKEKSEGEYLHGTLQNDVILLHSFLMRVFYSCIKKKLYFMGYLLLWLRLHK